MRRVDRLGYVIVLLSLGAGCDSTSPEARLELSINPSDLTLEALGAEARLTATVRKGGADITNEKRLSWRSSSVDVVSVTDNGNVVANGVGVAQVIAAVDRVADTARVMVEQVPRLITGNGPFEGSVGATLNTPLAVRVVDAGGSAVPGVDVSFGAMHGSVAPRTVSTDADGAAVSIWTLGTVATAAGTWQHAWAEVAQDPSVRADFTASAAPGEPTHLVKVVGDDQGWIEGQESGVEVVIQIADQYANGVSGREIRFEPRGSGAVDPSTTATGPTGTAAAEWFPGESFPLDAGSETQRIDTLRVETVGLALDPVTFTATVFPKRLEDVSRENFVTREGEQYYVTAATIHTCPDSNLVIVTLNAGDSQPKAAAMVQTSGECPGDGSIIYDAFNFTMPEFGIEEGATADGWSYQLRVRGLVTEGPGFGSICPGAETAFANNCARPTAYIAFEPSVVPPNDNFETVVKLDGSESYSHPDAFGEGEELAFTWILPEDTQLQDESSLTNAAVSVRFPSAPQYDVGLVASGLFSADTAWVTIYTCAYC